MSSKYVDPNVRRCMRKALYTSERKANGAARYYSKKYNCKTKPYRCPICNHWHLTTQGNK